MYSALFNVPPSRPLVPASLCFPVIALAPFCASLAGRLRFPFAGGAERIGSVGPSVVSVLVVAVAVSVLVVAVAVSVSDPAAAVPAGEDRDEARISDMRFGGIARVSRGL